MFESSSSKDSLRPLRTPCALCADHPSTVRACLLWAAMFLLVLPALSQVPAAIGNDALTPGVPKTAATSSGTTVPPGSGAPSAPNAQSAPSTPDFSPGIAIGARGEKPGTFKYPVGMAFDLSGRLWVADWGNRRVQIFSPDFKSAKTLEADLDGPCGVAMDSRGYMYVSEIRNNRISKFDKNGEFVEHIGGYGRKDGTFKEPRGIAVDADDCVYVADTRNDRIQKFDRNGKFLFKIVYRDKRERFESPRWVARDGSGSGIYAVYPRVNKVVRFDSDGNWVSEFGARGSQPGFFDEPRCVAVDYRGMVYVSDYGNDRIQRFESDGRFAEIIGIALQKGKKATGALAKPEGVAFDRFGNLFVSDADNNRIQCFDLRAELLYRNQAESFQASGDSDQAVKAYLKVLELTPGDAAASKYLKRSMLSDAAEAEEAKNWEKAIAVYMKMAELNLIDKENHAEELKKISFLRYRWIYYSLAASLVFFLIVAALIVRLGPSGKTAASN